MVATPAQRLPACGLPQCGHCPQGTSASIGALYALMMHKRSSASIYLARGTKRPTITPSPTRFGNGLKPAIAHARGNRTHRPYPTRARIVRLTPVTARGLGPCNRGILQCSPQRQTLTIARLNRPDTRNCATRYDLDHPARDRLHETQRPQASAATAAPLVGPACAYEPNSDYRKRSTPPPARSRHPPVHTISDSDLSDAEARPRWSCSPPHKAPHRVEDTLPGHRQRSAPDSRSLHTATTSRSRLPEGRLSSLISPPVSSGSAEFPRVLFYDGVQSLRDGVSLASRVYAFFQTPSIEMKTMFQDPSR